VPIALAHSFELAGLLVERIGGTTASDGRFSRRSDKAQVDSSRVLKSPCLQGFLASRHARVRHRRASAQM
jgi:hypothetical protein